MPGLPTIITATILDSTVVVVVVVVGWGCTRLVWLLLCLMELEVPRWLSYGPPWAHYLDGYQDRLLGGPLGLPGLRYTAPEGVEHKDYEGVVLG
jgi:hypothetical protein